MIQDISWHHETISLDLVMSGGFGTNQILRRVHPHPTNLVLRQIKSRVVNFWGRYASHTLAVIPIIMMFPTITTLGLVVLYISITAEDIHTVY